MHIMRLKLVGLVASLLVALSEAGGSAENCAPQTVWQTAQCNTVTQWQTAPGTTVTQWQTAPGTTVYKTVTDVVYSTQYDTVTNVVSVTGPTVYNTVTNTAYSTKYDTVTNVVSVTGPTVYNTVTATAYSTIHDTVTNVVTNVVSVPGPTITNTITNVITHTVTNVVSVPGPTVTNVITNTVSIPGPTVSVPGPTRTNTVTVSVPGPTVSVPGPTVSVPGPTVTSTVRVTVTQPTTVVQPTTATVVRSTTVVSSTTATVSRTVTVVNLSTITNTVSTTIVSTSVNTVSTCPTTALVGLVTCTSRVVNPTYTPPAPLPSNYLWGCPPGKICTPPQIGCNWEQNPPADTYVCAPSECKPVPALPLPANLTTLWPSSTADDCAWYQPTLGYFHLNPQHFNLTFAIFDVYGQPVCPAGTGASVTSKWTDWRDWPAHTATATANKPKATSAAPKMPRRGLWRNPLAEIGQMVKRQFSTAPAPCYRIFDAASLIGQSVGKVRNVLCPAGSEFQTALTNCRTCAAAYAAVATTTDDFPELQEYFSFCAS